MQSTNRGEMTGPLDILVVGGGSAGRRHFRYLTEYGQRCAVCDPSDDCRVLKEFPGAEHFREFASANLSRFDAVVICTPPTLHIPQLIAAGQAGCHLLSEKPLTVLNNDGLEELQQVVDDKNLVAAVAFPYGNMQAMDRIVELHQEGRLGAIRSLHIHYGDNILRPRPDFFKTYYGHDDQGGGCLQDDVMHCLFGLELLLGPELAVTCQRHKIGIKDVSADDTAFLWIRYPGDVVVSIDSTLQCHSRYNEWLVNGEKVSVRFDVDQPAIEIFDPQTEQTTIEKFGDTWDETFRANDHNFVDSIVAGSSVRCTLEMAITNHRAVLAARRSADVGREITLAEL